MKIRMAFVVRASISFPACNITFAYLTDASSDGGSCLHLGGQRSSVMASFSVFSVEVSVSRV